MIDPNELERSAQRGFDRGVNPNKIYEIPKVFEKARKKAGVDIRTLAELSGIPSSDLVDLATGMLLPNQSVEIVEKLMDKIPIDTAKFAQAKVKDLSE